MNYHTKMLAYFLVVLSDEVLTLDLVTQGKMAHLISSPLGMDWMARVLMRSSLTHDIRVDVFKTMRLWELAVRDL